MDTPRLTSTTVGTGPDLFFIHGWALHGGVFDEIAQTLAPDYRVTCVDLPGHGRSRDIAMPPCLGMLSDLLFEAAPARATWVGWSLGGMAALTCALDLSTGAGQSGRIARIVGIGTTPRFVKDPAWPYGQERTTLAALAVGLSQDYTETLRRFLLLNLPAGTAPPARLREIERLALARGAPAPSALRVGLDLLTETDLRPALKEISVPVRLIHGDKDRLVHPQAARALAGGVPDGSLQLMPGAAHAPFLSHPARFLEALHHALSD